MFYRCITVVTAASLSALMASALSFSFFFNRPCIEISFMSGESMSMRIARNYDIAVV